MDWFSWSGNLASILGLGVAAFTLYYARSARGAAREARKEVRKANASEVLNKIGDNAILLQACVEHDQHSDAVLRARDLVADISQYKIRYARFLDPGSMARLDEARAQISVISRFLVTRGASATDADKSRLLRICHSDVVTVLSEESARIIAALEREKE